MKVVIITIIILILFLGGAIYFSNYVEEHTGKLIVAIDELDEAIMMKDWKLGEERLKKVKTDWNEVKGIFENLLEHYDLDAISGSIAKIEKFMEIEDQSMTLGEITQLRFIIDLIRKKETFSLSNLL